MISKFSQKKVCIVDLKPNKDLMHMNELYMSGQVKPVIHCIYKLEEVPDAFRVLGESTHKGKIVIIV